MGIKAEKISGDQVGKGLESHTQGSGLSSQVPQNPAGGRVSNESWVWNDGLTYKAGGTRPGRPWQPHLPSPTEPSSPSALELSSW